MLTLQQLFQRDSVHSTWFWTHEVSTGPDSEYEVWNVVYVRTLDEPSVTGGDTRRTVYITGIPGYVPESRRENSGTAQSPSALPTLADLLMAARDVDDYPLFIDWIEHTQNIGREERVISSRMIELTQEHRRDIARRNALRGWLGDDYDAYVKAAAEYLAEQ